MALAFNDSAGGAKKNSLEYIKMEMGENKMRLIGGIVPRYVYWKQLGTNNIPVECLAFDRKEERFMNLEKDWFNHYFPKDDKGEDIRCVWSYVALAIDLKDGKLKLCGLKKKLFEQIKAHATKHLGDPTNPTTGWDIVFEKKKTGPHAFNIEYALDQMSCQTRELNEAEMELVENMPDIDTLILAKELAAGVVSADKGIKAWTERMGIRYIEANFFPQIILTYLERLEDLPASFKKVTYTKNKK